MIIERTAYAEAPEREADGPRQQLAGLVGNCLACNMEAFHPSGARRLPLPTRHHTCRVEIDAASLHVARERVRSAA